MDVSALLALPWPMMAISDDGKVLGTTQAMRLLLGLEQLTRQHLDERFQVLRGDGRAFARYELPWNRAARGEEFEERQVWLDEGQNFRLPVLVQTRMFGDAALLMLTEHPGRLLSTDWEQILSSLPSHIRCDGRSSAGDRLCELSSASLASQGALLLGSVPASDQLVLLGSHGISEEALSGGELAPSSARGLLGTAARTRQLQEVTLEDRGRRPGPGDLLRRAAVQGFRAAVILPVLALGEVVGVLAIVRRQPGRLAICEWRGLVSLASACGFALRDSRYREEERRGYRRLRALHAAGVALQLNLPLESLLRRLVELACDLTRARNCWMRLCGGPGGEDSWVPDRPLAQADGLMEVPFNLGSETFGTFVLQEPEEAPFTEEDRKLMHLFSAQAALAVGYARQADHADRESRRLTSLLEEIPEGLVFLQADQREAIVNRAARSLLGTGAGAVRVETLHGLLVPDPAGAAAAAAGSPFLRALAGGVVFNYRALVARADAKIPIALSAVPLRSEREEVVGAVAVLVDLSEQTQLDRLREEATAQIAHDLRSPVNALLGQAALIQRAATSARTPDLARGLERMRRIGLRLDRMITDLLDTARIETQQLAMELRAVPITRLVEELISELTPALNGHPVEIAAPGEVVEVLADPLRLQQVLTNLLENAGKYSQPTSPIRVEIQVRDHGCTITVRDQGPGISPSDLPHVFDRFFQTEAGTSHARRGLGLGLYISRRLIEAQGGRTWAESTPGVGSAFHVWVPLAGTLPLEVSAPPLQ